MILMLLMMLLMMLMLQVQNNQDKPSSYMSQPHTIIPITAIIIIAHLHLQISHHCPALPFASVSPG